MATYSVRIIPVPEHIIGGPYMVQVVTDGALKVAALRTGIATRERAEQVAAEYRRAYPAAAWSVIVGNVGTVYCGGDEAQARASYAQYCAQSASERGRAGGEPVTLLFGDDIVAEHAGNFSAG